MKVELQRPQAKSHPITIGDETFEIEIKPPSLADRLADTELLSLRSKEDGSWLTHRVKTTVVGWSNLLGENDEPIPFSWDNLAALCEQFEEVCPQLIALAHEAYRPLSTGDRKN